MTIMINLSERLKTIYDLIDPGETVADVGTDAGLLPAALLKDGRSPRVIMTDISQGSLDKCREYVAKNLPPTFQEGLHYQLRQGDGLTILKPSEVDTVVMAGIGGMLAPMLVGVLLVHGAQMNSIFVMFASVFVIVSIIVLSLGVESKRKSLEEIDASFKVKTT